MPAGRPVTVPLKIPVPLPFCTLLLAVVGAVAVPQTMPRSTTGPPPSAVTFPPMTTVVLPIVPGFVVVTVGGAMGTAAGAPARMVAT